MKDLKKKRKYILIAILVGLIAIIAWVLFLIWYLSGFTNRLTEEQKQHLEASEQGKSDGYFSQAEQKFFISHPWYDKLPYSTDKYFLFYHPIEDFFIVDFYLPQNSPESEPLKEEVRKYLTSVGVDVSRAKFLWNYITSPITPGP